MKIKLYHGTSLKTVHAIQKSGFLDSPYLTSSLDQAEYYAECVSEEENSDMQILTVEVETNSLHADTASFNEPLTYILNEHGMNESDWHKAIKNGKTPYPAQDDWKTSLQYVFSVKSTNSILISDIIFSQDANTIVDDYHSVISKKSKPKY